MREPGAGGSAAVPHHAARGGGAAVRAAAYASRTRAARAAAPCRPAGQVAVGQVTRALILANVGAFVLQLAFPDLQLTFALWPPGPVAVDGVSAGFRPWQLVSYAFLHQSVPHLGLNMLALWMFGRDCEAALGARRYLALYAAAVVTAAAAQLAVAILSGSRYPTIGASGGIFGVLLAFAVLFPDRRILLLIPPVPMPARVFVVVYGFIELANGVLGTRDGVAHFAHLGGMLGAWWMLRRWRRAAR
ncbi:MAG: rhomboid family intramembrane serine protease [Proteobacteria bacterium]|nr:rhomboid family intramembrane serine protease [Pseudomonadota bacterium]